MKLHISTDYAIRIVLHLAQCAPLVVSAPAAAEEIAITYPYFTKVASSLKKAGLIESVMGNSGGYRLAKDAADISLYDIICVMQGEICINRCLEEDGMCSRFGTESGQCPVHQVLEDLQGDMIAKLKGQTIANICKRNKQIKPDE